MIEPGGKRSVSKINGRLRIQELGRCPVPAPSAIEIRDGADLGLEELKRE